MSDSASLAWQALMMGAERLINPLLKADPASKARLKKLENRLIGIASYQPQLGCFIHCHDDGISLLSHWDGKADVTLYASASRLIQLGLSADPRQLLYAEDVTLEGDVTVLQDLQQLIRDLDIDWERALAVIAGEMPAHAAAQLMRQIWQWKVAACKTQLQNLKEFLHFESNLVPVPTERRYFTEQLEQLVQDTDRLAARFEQLKAQRAKEEQNP